MGRGGEGGEGGAKGAIVPDPFSIPCDVIILCALCGC